MANAWSLSSMEARGNVKMFAAKKTKTAESGVIVKRDDGSS